MSARAAIPEGTHARALEEMHTMKLIALSLSAASMALAAVPAVANAQMLPGDVRADIRAER